GVRTVLQQRERLLVDQLRQDLAVAEKQVKLDTTLPAATRRRVAARIRTLRRFADAAGLVLDGFLESRRLSFTPLRKILMAPLRRRSASN
ncbi:MAG: hypothetical protein KAI47_03000, partial [Deltaproteobacteria bacterium]|nr:hypothetical protein [Deltaproteobacteria bacterium]